MVSQRDKSGELPGRASPGWSRTVRGPQSRPIRSPKPDAPHCGAAHHTFTLSRLLLAAYWRLLREDNPSIHLRARPLSRRSTQSACARSRLGRGAKRFSVTTLPVKGKTKASPTLPCPSQSTTTITAAGGEACRQQDKTPFAAASMTGREGASRRA